MRVVPVSVLCAVLLSSGCRWTSADEQLLNEFFEASRIYDRTRLSRVATVVFNPVTDGVVHRFEIVETGADRAEAAGARMREVTIRAVVIPPDGAPAEHTLVIALTERSGRWIVSGVRRDRPGSLAGLPH